MGEVDSKRCLRCARPFEDRRRIRDFDAVHYCSAGCRRRKFSGSERAIAVVLLELLEARGAGKTLCPSEVARALEPDWRPLLPAVRAVARAFAAHGSVQATAGGVEVDAVDHPGPIRLGLVRGR